MIKQTKELIHGIRTENPEDLPLEILRVYLHNSEACRWSDTAWGSSESASNFVKQANDRLELEEKFLRIAIEQLERLRRPQ